MKKLHLGRLPGKAESSLKTLSKYLGYVQESHPEESDFTAWVEKEFPTITSEQYARDTIRTIENLGLIELSTIGYTQTDLARKFLETRDGKMLYEPLAKAYAAIDDTMQLLREKSLTLEELAAELQKRGIHWRQQTQYSVRLWWLSALGFVRRNGEHYTVLEAEPKTVKSPESSVPETSKHHQIQELLRKLGNSTGYSSEVEYRVEGRVLDVVWLNMSGGSPNSVFEIALTGDPSVALSRLKYARERFGRPMLFLITDKERMEQAKKVLVASFPEMKNIIQIVDWEKFQELEKAKEDMLEKIERSGTRRLIGIKRLPFKPKAR